MRDTDERDRFIFKRDGIAGHVPGSNIMRAALMAWLILPCLT